MKKSTILQAVLSQLEKDLCRLRAANEDASAGATHSEARAETKWDTCGLEASYLARGHAKQFEELAADLCELRAFTLPLYEGQPIGPGALIEVELGRENMWFFLLPCGGGVDVTLEEQQITIITPESPVGAALLDKQPGESYSFRAGTKGTVLQVL